MRRTGRDRRAGLATARRICPHSAVHARAGGAMFGFDIPQTTQALLAIGVVLSMFVLFLREVYPVEVTAIAGALALLVLGILPYDSAVAVLSNPAPWTIAALFVIVGALVRTGALDWIGQVASANVRARPIITLAVLTLTVLGLSAFVNNTPVVVVMIPIFMQLSRELGVAPSKLLIPLSYFAIFGGTITLVGTSTNLLVDGVAQAQGLAPFTIFEITPVGLAMSAVGVLYLVAVGRFLLPTRESMSALLTDRSKRKFFTEVAVPEGSDLIGEKLAEIEMFKRGGARVIDLLRGDTSHRREMGAMTLQVGDRVVLRTSMSEVLGMQESDDVQMVSKLSSVETTTVEALITPGCRMVGRNLGGMRLRRRYGVYPLAVHRRNQNIGRQLDDLVVQVGDTLLLEGTMEDIQRLAHDMDMVDIGKPAARAFRRGHAPIVVAVLAGIVLLSALGVAPILALGVLGVGIVLLTRCIDAEEAFGFVEIRLLALIFAMLAIGAGLEHSGAVALIAGAIAPLLVGLPPFLLLFAVFAMTSVLTEMVSNNAVAVVVAPIAIGLAATLGVDPRPLLISVMMAASASFSTPIGYQTNTLVYGPGGYRFGDFLKVGIPLNITMGLTSSAVIALLWPM
jgi:di/tricarboxylate transporter